MRPFSWFLKFGLPVVPGSFLWFPAKMEDDRGFGGGRGEKSRGRGGRRRDRGYRERSQRVRLPLLTLKPTIFQITLGISIKNHIKLSVMCV